MNPRAPGVARGTDRRRFWLLLGLAAVVRAAYGLEYAQLPLYWGPLMDSLVYERQAASILEGRFGDPALLAFSPLYGYFLALFGNTPGLWPFVVQLGLGTLSLGLLHRLAATLYDDERAGDVALLLGLGYGMLRFFDTKIMSESLGLTLLVAALYLQRHWHPGAGRDTDGALPRFGGGLVVGFLLGLAVLARASLLFLAILTPLVLCWWYPRRAAGIALALGAVFLANGLHNEAQTGLFVPVIFVSSTVATSNAASSSGDFSDFAGDDGFVSAFDVVDQAAAAIDAERRKEALCAAHVQDASEPSPGSEGFDLFAYLERAPGRALATLRDTETSYDYSYYGERSALRSWALAPVSIGALVLLGAGGLALLVRRRHRALLILAPVVLGTFATTTLFHASSRYRLPLALALLLLAAPLVVYLVDEARARRKLWLSAALCAACLFFSVRLSTYELRQPARWELLLAESALTAGDIAVADVHIARARRLAPGDAQVERRIATLRRASRGRGDEARGRVPTADAE